MSGQPERILSPLAEAEMEVLEEGRQWMRGRLERKLQEAADALGDFSPLERATSASPEEAPHRPSDERGRT